MSSALEYQFAQDIKRLVPAGTPLVVALSGGGDSMALLGLLHQSGQYPLTVAHIDHGLRPESGPEAEWLREYILQRFDRDLQVVAPTWSPQPGESLEMGARRMRFAALAEVRQTARADYVVLAHHADDQAETVLMRVLRGTGVAGLGGMQAMRGPWLRPLLSWTRQSLRGYLRQHQLTWLEDPSNHELHWLRNRVRHELMPHLRAHYNVRIDRALNDLADQARQWEAWARSVAEPWLREHGIDRDPTAWHLPASFAQLPTPVQGWIFAQFGQDHGLRLTTRHIRAALQGVCQWPQGYRVWVSSDGWWHLGPSPGPQPGPEWAEDGLGMAVALGVNHLPRGGQLYALPGPLPPDLSGTVLGWPPEELLWRYWRPGDRVRPHGMQGRRKLQDVFVDQKVPQWLRHCWPILVLAAEPDQVVAVPGLVHRQDLHPEPGWMYRFDPPQARVFHPISGVVV